MKNLPELSPKSDLWSKIQQQKDFDTQVKRHLGNLLERVPNADLWNSIESELDQKAPVIPLWRYQIVAASISILLAVSFIAYFQYGRKESDTKLITEVKTIAPIASPDDEFEMGETQALAVELEKSGNEKQPPLQLQNPGIDKEIEVLINPIKLNLEALSIEEILISEVTIPQIQQPETPQTLHQVRISWGIENKSKIRAAFGSNYTPDLTEKQLVRAGTSSNSIKIKFNKQ